MADVLRGWWRVARPLRSLVFPDVCPCCNEPTRERWEALDIPYCSACRNHQPKAGPWVQLILAGAAGGAAAVGAAAAFPFEGALFHALLAGGAGLVVVLLALGFGVLRRPGKEHAARSQAVEPAGHETYFIRRDYAERVAQLNGLTAEPCRAPLMDILETLLPLAGCVAAAAAVAWIHPLWHRTLWVDNALPSRVAVRIDGTLVATVASDAREKLSVPRRALRLEAVIDARVVDRQSLLGSREAGTWIFNVAGRRCYLMETHEYRKAGGFGLFGGRRKPVFGHLFPANVDYLFEPAPKKVEVDEISFKLNLAFRRSLVTVPCERRR